MKKSHVYTTVWFVQNIFLISQSWYKCIFSSRAVQLCIHCKAMHI